MKYHRIYLVLGLAFALVPLSFAEDVTLSFRGGTYHGEVLQGRPDGQGTWRLENGDTYVGVFLIGIPRQGEGAFELPDGSRYVGSYRYGLPHGTGTVTRPDGARYVGSFDLGIWMGEGTFTFPDGSTARPVLRVNPSKA